MGFEAPGSAIGDICKSCVDLLFKKSLVWQKHETLVSFLL